MFLISTFYCHSVVTHIWGGVWRRIQRQNGYRETEIVTGIEEETERHKSRDTVIEKETRDTGKETKGEKEGPRLEYPRAKMERRRKRRKRQQQGRKQR